MYAIWVYFRVFLPAHVHWFPKNTESDFFIIYSTCQQRKKPLNTGYPSIHSGTSTSPNSMWVRKCRGHLQATREFRIFSFMPPHWIGPISLPPPLLGWFYLALVLLSQAWPLIHSGDAYHHRVWCLGVSTTRVGNTSSIGHNENVSSLHSTSRSSPDAKNPSKSTIPHGVQVRWWVQGYPTRNQMYYLCFCSIVFYMLPKFNSYIFVWLYTINNFKYYNKVNINVILLFY